MVRWSKGDRTKSRRCLLARWPRNSKTDLRCSLPSFLPSKHATPTDDILKMLVKPMIHDVHVTVLMDCCHSGTVMDLPYKFGADDVRMTREEGFNMEMVKDGEKARKETEEQQKKDKGGDKEGDGKKKKKEKKKKHVSPKKKKELEEKREKAKEERERTKAIPVGPNRDASGVPQLPTRKAPKAEAKPSPDKKCSVM